MPIVSTFSDPAHDDPDQEFLNDQNVTFFASLGPTLAYIVLLMVAGVAGNAVVFAVYYKRFKPSVTRTFILAMSVCDLLTNTLSFPADVFELRFHNTFSAAWACKLSRTVKSSLSFMAAGILLSVALDRYRRMCRPYSRSTTLKHVRIILVICAVVAACITAPYTVLTGSQTVRFPDTNVTGFKCSIDDRFVKSTFLDVYNLSTFAVFVMSLVAMIVAYARIAHQLWQHKKTSGVSVTGRAVSRTAGNGAHVHTYTDQETTADGIDLSVRSACDTAEDLDRTIQLRSSPDLTAGDRSERSQDAEEAEAVKPAVDVQLSGGRPASTAAETGANDTSLARQEPEDATDETDVDSGLPPSAPESPTQAASAHDPVPDLSNAAVTATATTPTASNGGGATTAAATATKAAINNDPSDQTTPGSPTECCCVGRSTGKSHRAEDTSENGVGLATFSDNEDTLQPEMNASDRDDKSCSRTRLHVDASLPKSHTSSFLARNYVSKWRKTAGGVQSSFAARKARKRTASVRKIPTRTTFMMFVLTAIFVVNYLPYLVVVSLRSRMELLVERLGLNVYHLLIRSYFMHSAVNPLVYSFCSAKFREECRRLFNCRHRA